MELLIGLDVGTTSTKALLFNPQGQILASASQPYGLMASEGDRVEQDPQDFWNAAVTTLRSLSRQIGTADRVLAICQSSQGGTTIPADDAGNPVTHAISWMDQRARSEGGQALERFSEEEFYRTTGWPFQATLPFRHIIWLRRQTPEVFKRARRFLFVNDFIGHRLTGEYCMNPSDASVTHLFNIAQGDWDERLLELAGIQRPQLSPLKPSGAIVGTLTKQASLNTGLPAGIPLINGAHDQYCAAVGLGVTIPGPMLLSCGTAWVLLAVPETLEIGYQSRMAISCHAVPGRWGVMRAQGGVGASVEWLIDQVFAGADKSIGRKQLYAAVNESVLSSPPGAGGLLFYPLSGGHTELVYAGRGGFIGMNLKHTRADMARAVLEGVVFDLRWTLEEIQAADVCVDEMKMVGGGAGSSAWPQIVTDITGIPVVLPAIREAASWGAAILAGVGSGVFPDAAAGVSRTGPERRVEPNVEHRERYDELFGHYKRLCSQVCKAL